MSHRNLPHCVSEANIGQIWTRWVSRQQCSGHKPPPDHRWTERQQTPLLPKRVTLMISFPVWLSLCLSSVHRWFNSIVILLLSRYPHGFRSLWHQGSSFDIPRCFFLVFVLLFSDSKRVCVRTHITGEMRSCHYKEVDPTAVVKYNFSWMTSLYDPIDPLLLKEWWGISNAVLVFQMVYTSLLFSACNYTHLLQWNPNLICSWSDSVCHAVARETRRRCLWTNDVLCLESLLAFLIFIFLLEPRAHCGMKLARVRDWTGCDCWAQCWQMWNKSLGVFLSCFTTIPKEVDAIIITFLIHVCPGLNWLFFIALFGKPMRAICKKKCNYV